MPHILGDRVYLREYLLSDVEALYQWRTLDEIVWWTGSYLWPESLEQARAFVEAQVNNTDPANRKFAICRREDHKYLGHIGYEHLDLRRQNTEVGIVIGDVTSLSRGLGEESLRLFLKVCFEELNLHRVGLRVIRPNKRGYRCYRKCGFKEREPCGTGTTPEASGTTLSSWGSSRMSIWRPPSPDRGCIERRLRRRGRPAWTGSDFLGEGKDPWK